jgi:hypothetical protein
LLRQVVGRRRRERELAEVVLDDGFPNRGDAQVYLIRWVLAGCLESGRELRVGGDVPEEYVGCRGAASSPLEPPQDLLRQRRVEVVRDRECPSAEAKWARFGLGGGDGPQLSDRAASADYDEVLPGLNPVHQGVQIASELLQADGTHGRHCSRLR